MAYGHYRVAYAPQPITARVIVWSLLLLGIATSPVMAAGAPPSSTAVLERLQVFLDTLQTLEADFVQHVDNPENGVPTESSGHVSTTKPKRFRWDYRAPIAQTIVADGQRIWFYEPDLQQVTVSDIATLDDTPAALLSSGTQIPTLFSWEVFQDTTLNTPGVRLLPKKSSSVQEIILVLHPERDELLKLETSDSLGHKSHFSFQNMRTNQPIAKERFLFELPPNVDVIQDRSKPTTPQ